GIRKEVHAQRVGDVDGGDDGEPEELPARAQLEHVVDETQRHTEKRSESGEGEARGAHLLRDEEWMTGHAVDQPEREDRDAERQRDRETAGPRDGPRVDATASGHVEHPEPLREPAYERCDRCGKKERD